jgi:hypothetical protein
MEKIMEFLEKMKEYGVVVLEKNKGGYERWYKSDFPDYSNWGLMSDDKKPRLITGLEKDWIPNFAFV